MKSDKMYINPFKLILLTNRWNINFYMIEKQLVYLIAAHSQLNLSNSEVTLKQIVKTITQAYPKIDFNILLELGKTNKLNIFLEPHEIDSHYLA